jgi:hypothetical protein
MSRFLAPIPIQLTRLTLVSVIFTPESLPCGQRHSLPYLTSLTVTDVIFLGPLRDYFHCPKLIHLYYTVPLDDFIVDPAVRVSTDLHQIPLRETFDDAFFQESSALESLSFRRVEIDDTLASILARCPILHTLEFKECRIEKFAEPFLEELQDPTKFPSLQMLYIKNSWSTQLDVSYTEFSTQCSSKRPRIHIFGNTKTPLRSNLPTENGLNPGARSILAHIL